MPKGPYTPKRHNVDLLGRFIGTATGWDGDPDEFWWYDFVPVEGIDLPYGTLSINLISGYMGLMNASDGKIINPVDIPTFLVNVSRKD